MKMGKQQQLLAMVATATHLMLLVASAAIACTSGMAGCGLLIRTLASQRALIQMYYVNVMSQLTADQRLTK
jgi:hypothetical protein